MARRKYKIVKSLLTMCLFTLQISFAQVNISDTVNTVFFKISSATNPSTSYLFGTHHAFGAAFFDSLLNVTEALEMCEIMIKENLNIPQHTAQDIINRRTTETNWAKYVSKSDFRFLQTIFATSPTNYKKLTPTEMYVFLNRYYKQQICLGKSAADTSLSLDDYIGFKAAQQNIKLVGLETIEEQIALINKDVEGLPRKKHKKRLASIIEKIRTKNMNACAETDWYARLEFDYQWDSPCGNALVLTNRNQKWMKTIVELLDTNSCFIAVGLSHLMYDCGLIVQLYELGYTITPISVK